MNSRQSRSQIFEGREICSEPHDGLSFLPWNTFPSSTRRTSPSREGLAQEERETETRFLSTVINQRPLAKGWATQTHLRWVSMGSSRDYLLWGWKVKQHWESSSLLCMECLCSSQNSYVEAVIPSVAVFADEASKEVIVVKWGQKDGTLMQ